MRIGVILKADVPNIYYRAYEPVAALSRSGHDLRVVELQRDGRFDERALQGCDVVHVYRRAEQTVLAALDRLRARGVAVTWDNDDDGRLLHPDAPNYREVGGVRAQRDHQAQKKMLRRAHVVTTTSEVLAKEYRAAGAAEVVEVENYLADYQYADPDRHDGLVVGWVAGMEHRPDARALELTAVLRRLLERHPTMRVVTLGLRLDLDPTRYDHRPPVPFPELHEHLRGFDVGIAPLADIPMSYARSNVKVKEYAAASVPWLASSRGPYARLGSAEGGVLVDDGAWEEALDALLRSRLKRARLRRKARGWAKTQRLTAHLDKWNGVFERALQKAADEPHGADIRAVGSGRSR